MAGGNPHQHPCKIADCAQAAYRGDLCRTHYLVVPLAGRMVVATEAMTAAHNIGRKHHRRQLAYVRELVREGQAEQHG